MSSPAPRSAIFLKNKNLQNSLQKTSSLCYNTKSVGF